MTDKIDRLLEVEAQPERVTDAELNELLEDKETRVLYEMTRLAADALTEVPATDLDAEWKRFAHSRRKFPVFPLRQTAAALIFVAVSIAVIATGLGIHYNLQLPEQVDETTEARIEATATNVQPIVSTPEEGGPSETIVVFKNESFGKIIAEIAGYYGLELVIKNTSTASLRLYFQWNRSLKPAEVVDELNNFEQINLSLTDRTLNVE